MNTGYTGDGGRSAQGAADDVGAKDESTDESITESAVDESRATAGTSRSTLATDGGAAEGLTAGVTRVDITPDTGRSFQGYVRPDITAEGVGIRLFARALVLDDGERKIALVSADLLWGIDKEAVLERVRPLGFTSETLLYVGTHTHAATDAGEWTAAQIASAIAEADADQQPAAAGWGTATVEEANRTRSLEAHLANHDIDLYPGTGTHDLDPEGPDHPRDTSLQLLRVDTRDGDPLAVWSQFAVHPTAFTPHNTVYSADIAGAATRQFRAQVGSDAPLALFANGTEGDLIPIYDEYNQYALAESVGGTIAEGMIDAWTAAGENLDHMRVGGRGTTITYEGQRVGPGKRVASRSTFGLPFLGGGVNGPSLLYFLGLEGRRRPSLLMDAVHGRKIPVAPAPWSSDVKVQVVRLGGRLLLAVPGEPTVEMGRRSARDVAAAVSDEYAVDVVGLANEYNGYFTTPEEYDQQHYEGGHTTFGKHSEALLRQAFVDLATDIDEGLPPGNPETVAGGSSPRLGDSPAAPVGRTADGRIVAAPSGPVERFSVIEVEWQAGRAGRDRPIGDPFIHVERETDKGWTTVDTDLDLGLVWTVQGRRHTARYELPPGTPTGTYRVRITGAGYECVTDPFTVVPATSLRVRGVELGDALDDADVAMDDGGSAGADQDPANGEQLVIRAQNPPPDPDCHLRSRAVIPPGGTVMIAVDGEEHEATWDGDRLTASIPGVSSGDTVRVPAAGFEDAHGNTSAGPVSLEVGAVDPVDWPSDMGPGGGRPPGPFGYATWPF